MSYRSDNPVPRPPLTIAVLGCGAAAAMHARRLRRIEGVELWFASRRPQRAREYCRRYGGAGHFEDYEPAISHPRTHAVLITTPPRFHLEQTMAALGAARHVIVEKPPFLRAADVDAVALAARRADRQVCVAENYFYKPLLVRLRDLIRSGVIGEVRQLYVNAMKHQPSSDWRADPELAGGGALFEGGIHWINFMASLGLAVRTVTARRPGGAGSEPDREMVVTFEYHEGAIGTLFFSWNAPSPLRGLRVSRIYGTEGSIAFESNGLWLAVTGRRYRAGMPGLRDIGGYGAMLEDFVHALRANVPPAMTLTHAQRDLALVEEAYRSAAAPVAPTERAPAVRRVVELG